MALMRTVPRLQHLVNPAALDSSSDSLIGYILGPPHPSIVLDLKPSHTRTGQGEVYVRVLEACNLY
jgi:hypothetical protein